MSYAAQLLKQIKETTMTVVFFLTKSVISSFDFDLLYVLDERLVVLRRVAHSGPRVTWLSLLMG